MPFPSEQAELSHVLIHLFRGVVYRTERPRVWQALVRRQAVVRDHIELFGLRLFLDEVEGYAFLRQHDGGVNGGDGGSGAILGSGVEAAEVGSAGGAGSASASAGHAAVAAMGELPRLVHQRPLSYPVSLLLALLRKKLAEHDASGGDPRLILTRDDMAELVRLFLPESGDEVRFLDRMDSHIRRVVELGFLRRLRGQKDHYEVQRILAAFVDAQWLDEFESRLAQYRAHALGEQPGDESGDDAR